MTRIKKDRTIKIRMLEDELSKYIPFCSFPGHPGVPYDDRKCVRRKCNYYNRFRSLDDIN